MVAPNGARLKYWDHKSLPLKLDEIVNTAKICEEAGANAIHLHVRDKNFEHILDKNIYQETISAIKKECSQDFIIQATTEAVGKYKPEDIITLVKELKPQCSSVALKEIITDFEDSKQLNDAKKFYKFASDENIGIQHILYSKDDLIKFYKLLEQDIISQDRHSILFVLGRYNKDLNCDTSEIIPFLSTLESLSMQNYVDWMVCAFGQKEIPSLVNAAILDGHCRIGFENSRVKISGEKALDNASQISTLKDIFHSLNINKISPEKMRNVLGIYK